MIVLNIKQLCRERGIKHPLAELKKAGISHFVASAYMKEKKVLFVTQHLETLCTLLRCTPNDLFKWVPDDPHADYPENPMQAIRQKPSFNLEEKLKNMTLEEIKAKFGE